MSRQPIVPAQRRRRVYTVVHFVVLAVYTVPKGLLKKAVQKRITKRRRLLKESTDKKNENDVVLLQHGQRDEETDDVVTLEEHLAKEPTEAVALENEMWARFAGTGFWRSDSQREP